MTNRDRYSPPENLEDHRALIEVARERHDLNPDCLMFGQPIHSCPDPLCRDAVAILGIKGHGILGTEGHGCP